jgi:hypothetical protein
MQEGPRVLYGTGCAEAKNGQHVVEFNETGTAAWCCQCAVEMADLERRKAFMRLPIEERRKLMAASASAFMEGYENYGNYILDKPSRH